MTNRGDWMRTAASIEDVLDDVRSARLDNARHPGSPGVEVALERCEDACLESIAAFEELLRVLK